MSVESPCPWRHVFWIKGVQLDVPCPWRDVFGLDQVSWILLLVNIPEMQKRSCKKTNPLIVWFNQHQHQHQPTSVQLLPLTWAVVLTVVMVFSTWTITDRSYRNFRDNDNLTPDEVLLLCLWNVMFLWQRSHQAFPVLGRLWPSLFESF